MKLNVGRPSVVPLGEISAKSRPNCPVVRSQLGRGRDPERPDG